MCVCVHACMHACMCVWVPLHPHRPIWWVLFLSSDYLWQVCLGLCQAQSVCNLCSKCEMMGNICLLSTLDQGITLHPIWYIICGHIWAAQLRGWGVTFTFCLSRGQLHTSWTNNSLMSWLFILLAPQRIIIHLDVVAHACNSCTQEGRGRLMAVGLRWA